MFKIIDFLIENKSTSMTLFSLALLGTSLTQNKVLYVPEIPGLPRSNSENPYRFRSPGERKIPYIDVEIKSLDGILLKGWLLKQKNSTQCATIIIFHENAGNIGNRLEYLNYYYEIAAVNILIVSYRGYSDSEGSPSEEGLQKDSIAILDYAFKCPDINNTKIFTHGRSLGGATSTYGVTNGDFKIAGMILENTFTSIDNIISSYLPSIAPCTSFILKNKWDTLSLIPKIETPILFIISGKDEIVPSFMMEKLYEASTSMKKIKYLIPEGDHNSNWSIDPLEYFIQISTFIKNNT